ncbi:MAG: cytochrome c maturation protein CcmE [Azospirillum brasilense]|nr:MAG: cytochrome c maturation protein CcmE [Azospirillum brasilense]
MKPKHKRLILVVLSVAVMGGAAAAVLSSFRDSLVFFYTPTQWQQKQQAGTTTKAELRIGGLVKEGSVTTTDDGTMRFIITDLTHELPVRYRGMVPALFREGQGVVAQGSIGPDGTLTARTILAKHDENYMPREVVEALKQSGRWQHVE